MKTPVLVETVLIKTPVGVVVRYCVIVRPCCDLTEWWGWVGGFEVFLDVGWLCPALKTASVALLFVVVVWWSCLEGMVGCVSVTQGGWWWWR